MDKISCEELCEQFDDDSLSDEEAIGVMRSYEDRGCIEELGFIAQCDEEFPYPSFARTFGRIYFPNEDDNRVAEEHLETILQAMEDHDEDEISTEEFVETLFDSFSKVYMIMVSNRQNVHRMSTLAQWVYDEFFNVIVEDFSEIAEAMYIYNDDDDDLDSFREKFRDAGWRSDFDAYLLEILRAHPGWQDAFIPCLESGTQLMENPWGNPGQLFEQWKPVSLMMLIFMTWKLREQVHGEDEVVMYFKPSPTVCYEGQLIYTFIEFAVALKEAVED